MEINKTKIQIGQEWVAPWGIVYERTASGWNAYVRSADASVISSHAEWLDAFFEVEKPLRTKEFDGIVYREDFQVRHRDNEDGWGIPLFGYAYAWHIVAQYEGWARPEVNK